MPRPREAEPADAPEAEPLGPGVFTGFPRLRTVLSVAVGIALMVLLIRHSGVDDVHDRFDVLGARSPLVLLPFVVIAWMDARGWRCTLPGGGAYVPMRAVYMARLAGEAVNSLTPTAALGEPVKAYLLRPWGVTGSDGLASIVIALRYDQSFCHHAFAIPGSAPSSTANSKTMTRFTIHSPYGPARSPGAARTKIRQKPSRT